MVERAYPGFQNRVGNLEVCCDFSGWNSWRTLKPPPPPVDKSNLNTWSQFKTADVPIFSRITFRKSRRRIG